MSAVVIISYAAGRMARGGPDTGATNQALPSTRRATRTLARLSAAAADLIPASVAATAHRQLAGYRLAGLRVGDRGLQAPSRGPAIFTTRKYSRQPLGAGNRLPGSARVNDANQPSHVCCPFTHVKNSFSATAFHEQNTMEGIPDDAKTGARPRNLTARSGNYAC